MNTEFKQKYLKYKKKYLDLLNEIEKKNLIDNRSAKPEFQNSGTRSYSQYFNEQNKRRSTRSPLSSVLSRSRSSRRSPSPSPTRRSSRRSTRSPLSSVLSRSRSSRRSPSPQPISTRRSSPQPKLPPLPPLPSKSNQSRSTRRSSPQPIHPPLPPLPSKSNQSRSTRRSPSPPPRSTRRSSPQPIHPPIHPPLPPLPSESQPPISTRRSPSPPVFLMDSDQIVPTEELRKRKESLGMPVPITLPLREDRERLERQTHPVSGSSSSTAVQQTAEEILTERIKNHLTNI